MKDVLTLEHEVFQNFKCLEILKINKQNLTHTLFKLSDKYFNYYALENRLTLFSSRTHALV